MNKTILPAERLSLTEEYYFSRNLAEVARMRQEGHDVISLAIGSPDLPPPPAAIDMLCNVAHDPRAHGYQPTKGTPELRAAMARFYRRHFNVDIDSESEVLPLIGSKEGILHTTLAFVNPGDTVLVPDPGYPTYTSLSKLLGAQVLHYPLLPESGYQPDFEFLEHLDTTRVRLLWVNYPHMPTGARPQHSTYQRLVAYARERGIVIVNDNPYSFILNSGSRMSIMQVEGARECCVELNSMSKSHNMPGWRVGMLVACPKFIQWVLKVKSNIDSGTFRGLQLAAAAAIDADDEWHRQFNVEVYAARRHYAEAVMRALGCKADFESQTGMFLWGRIPDDHPLLPSLHLGEADIRSEKFADRILQDADVFITPGFIFGRGGNDYVRLSLCAPEERIAEALERIERLQLA